MCKGTKKKIPAKFFDGKTTKNREHFRIPDFFSISPPVGRGWGWVLLQNNLLTILNEHTLLSFVHLLTLQVVDGTIVSTVFNCIDACCLI